MCLLTPIFVFVYSSLLHRQNTRSLATPGVNLGQPKCSVDTPYEGKTLVLKIDSSLWVLLFILI